MTQSVNLVDSDLQGKVFIFTITHKPSTIKGFIDVVVKGRVDEKVSKQ